MPTYFDPITQEHLTLSSEQETQLYLVKHDQESYHIHAVSSGLHLLVKDPATSATEYWLIEEVDVFISKVNEHELNEILFPKESLTTHNLPLALFNYLDIHPEINEPKSFSREMAETLRREDNAYLFELAAGHHQALSPLLSIAQHLSQEQIDRLMRGSLEGEFPQNSLSIEDANDSEEALAEHVSGIGGMVEARSARFMRRSGFGFFSGASQSSEREAGVELMPHSP